MSSETVIESAKHMPAVGVGGAFLLGIPLSTWALIVPIVYYVLLTVFLLRDKLWSKKNEHTED